MKNNRQFRALYSNGLLHLVLPLLEFAFGLNCICLLNEIQIKGGAMRKVSPTFFRTYSAKHAKSFSPRLWECGAYK